MGSQASRRALLAVLGDPEEHGRDALELYGVSRICERRGDAARARTLYEKSLAGELPAETGRAAQRSLARLAKRGGDLRQARELWEKMLGNSREGLEAYEQLAIYHEHRARDPHVARALVRRALAELGKAERRGGMAPGAQRQSRARFERRLARLERKMGRMLLDASQVEATS